MRAAPQAGRGAARPAMRSAAAVATAAGAAGAAAGGNMNGRYAVASGGRQNVPFNDDYASKGHEFFDVYAPEIATRYGEVFWAAQPAVALPAGIVRRFAGKAMAITGYEQDQVFARPGGGPGDDVSVPITWAYNHHYSAVMAGRHARVEEVPAGPADPHAHGAETKLVLVDRPSAAARTATAGLPTGQFFAEGDGGESRRSFHGYPDGYAQIIDSPETFTMVPMQIDTRNRDCGATAADVANCTAANPVPFPRFTPGPEPRASRMGLGVPDGTPYSGLLECPCTTRYGGEKGNRTKVVERAYTVRDSGACAAGQQVASAVDCFAAVRTLGVDAATVTTATVSDPALPPGCSVETFGNGSAAAYFNAGGEAACGKGAALRVAGRATSDVGVTLALDLDPSAPGGNATITVSGPAIAWFGVGLAATQMNSQPYSLIVNASGVIEQKLATECPHTVAEHCAGDTLAPSVAVLSNTVAGGVRTVVVTRGFKGKTANHHTFDVVKDATLPFISAVGTGPVFAWHKAHAAATVSLTAEGTATCVCDAGVVGRLCDSGGVNCQSFTKYCVGAPDGSLLAQRNPTCNSTSYIGGQWCCGHGKILLDADQETRPELLRYRMKFRFWFQEYSAGGAARKPSHQNLDRIYYQTEAWAGEYDVPPAFAPPLGYPAWPAGVPTPGTNCTGACPGGPDCECVHSITFRWKIPNPMRLIYAGGHCHAPSCLSMELYRADTGALLCRQVPVYGKGTFPADRFDEEGYLALPPCLWGDDDGLDKSVRLPAGTPLLAVKRNRNTRTGHFGEMASWQMRGINYL